MNKVGKVSSPKVPALGKAVALLKAIAREPSFGFAGIQERLGVPKRSIHYHISTTGGVGLIKPRSLGRRCKPIHRGSARRLP